MNLLFSSLELKNYYRFAYIQWKRTPFKHYNMHHFEELNNNILECDYSLVNMN
jgi:hypothetical protein